SERYTLFVRPRDKEKETWTGRRAGVEGAKEKFGADAAFSVEEFQEKLSELLDGARNLYYRLGDGHPELDQAVVRQIASMRGRGVRGLRLRHHAHLPRIGSLHGRAARHLPTRARLPGAVHRDDRARRDDGRDAQALRGDSDRGHGSPWTLEGRRAEVDRGGA